MKGIGMTAGLILFCFVQLHAQVTIYGKIVDKKKRPVGGVSLVLAGTLKTAVSDSSGAFVWNNIQPRDTFILKASSIGFNDDERRIPLSETKRELLITLKEKTAQLADVVVQAGTFEAGDQKKTTVMKAFDLATTPTASPDVFGAIQQLPGTTKVGESEGLFVRGGDATETKAVIDGLIVQDPFFSSIPGIAQKGRFSPLLFKGTAFSTGGYSAQYGQALSSILLLNTQDLAQSTSSSLTLSTSGINGSVVKRWKETSLMANGNYFNIKPSFAINPQNYKYERAPEGASGNITFRQKGKDNSMFKLYASYSVNDLSLKIPFPSSAGKNPLYDFTGNNLYINSTYKRSIGSWTMNTGYSFSTNKDDVVFDSISIIKKDSRMQARVVMDHSFNSKTKLYIGSEAQYVRYASNNNASQFQLNDLLISNFVESEFYITHRIAARAGVRSEISTTINKANIAPRVSVAWVINRNNQLSVAFGDFHQLPSELYLYSNKKLSFENAIHYIINYQFTKNQRTFRLEAYYKDYNHLVKEISPGPFNMNVPGHIPNGNTDNSGKGYAKGFEAFWYDKKSIHNLDYWISYSFLDTKRINRDYPGEVMPTYAANHNLSVVAKYNIPKTTVNLGATYNYTSGRPYYDPNAAFLSGRTPPVHNVILNFNYAIFYKNNLVALFANVDNVLGIKNVNNYAYSIDGAQRYDIRPPAYRSIYAGVHISFSKKKRSIMGINL